MEWDSLIGAARRRGRIPKGEFRVMVIESDGRTTGRNFATLQEATAYADDAASEYGDYPPVAIVLDDGFQVVHEGGPYYAS